ncbi:MAG: leucine-rich repeat protein [Ruminococcus sp.]|nr:leucine-rich repeat protein [Ruminococcus sp.]
MGKRMISLLLSLVLLAGMTAVVPTVGAAETQSEQTGASGTTGSCTWSLSGTVLTISGNGRMKDYNVSYNSKPPWGTNITQVIVNYGVTYIGEDAFYGCENLTEVHLADGTLTEIGESAFAMCKNLEEIVIPDSVETIQSYVFGYCFALKEVTLSKNLSFLGFDAFLRCHALEHIELPDSITSLAGEVFYMCTALKSVRLPAHLDSICSGAFQSCAALESLELPDTLTIIQSTAFRGCTKLAAINIPSGVTDFGASVFEGTAWLKNQPEGGLYINNCLLDYVGECPEVLTVRDGTVKIYGLMNQPTLQKVVIPHSVTAILNSAFSGCTALTDFVIPDSVTRIGSRSLENTAWLKRQPDGIVTVDGILYQYKDCPRFVRVDARVVAAGAFGGSETLEEVEIHEGVAYINAGAFADCPALVAAGFFSDACAIGDGAFLNSPQLVFYCSHNSTAHLYAKENNIPFRKVSGQIGDLRWVMEGTKLTVYGSGNIPSGNGPWHDDVTEIVLGKGVGSVGNSAFGNLSKLDKLVVQSRTTSFDAWTLPAGRKVGVYCYKGSEADKRLKPNVVHPITVTYLGEKGDANIDGAVNIGDATFLQMLLAEYSDRLLTAGDPDVLAQGDMNDDGRLTVSDVTAIQRYLAEAATVG